MKFKVVYSVVYACDLDVPEGESVEDALADIDIPEGGQNNSEYRINTFKILQVSDAD